MRRIASHTGCELVAAVVVSSASCRCFGSAPSSDVTTEKSMKELMDMFGEARELIGDARESLGTVYFSDDLEDAIKAKDDVLSTWKSVQAQLGESGSTDVLGKLQREHDVKFRQLEAEVEELMSHDD